MSTIYKGQPPATYFNSLCRRWHGTGVVIHKLPNDSDDAGTLDAMLSDLNTVVCTLKLGLPDPGRGAVSSDDTAMELLWTNAGLDESINELFSSLTTNNFRQVVLCVSCPISWLTDVMFTLTGTNMLSAYVRYVCGCVAWLKAILPTPATALIKYIEVYDEPDKDMAHVSPRDIAALTTMLHSALSTKYGTAIRVTGPALSQVVAMDAVGEPYTDSFQNRGNSLNKFTCHVEPNAADAAIPAVLSESASSDECCRGRTIKTIIQRDALCRSLDKNVAYQVSVFSAPIALDNSGWSKERWVTSWGKRPRTVVSSGRTASECYGIAAARTMCAILLNGFSTACFHRLAALNNAMAPNGLYTTSSSVPIFEPWGAFYARLGAVLPVDGQLYVSEEISSGDNTLKSLVLSENSDVFTMLLCRPETPDTLTGTLRLVIRNPLWSDQYRMTDVSLHSFPTRDLSNVDVTTQVRQGQGIITLNSLPYESTVVLITGQVLLNPPLIPPSPPSGPPSTDDDGNRLQTIIQVPINYGTPSLALSGNGPVPGCLYYDTEDDTAKVYIDSQWIDVTMLT